MKIVIDRSILASALSEVTPFVPQKTNLLILKNAKITTRGNRVKIEASDTGASIRRYVEAVEVDRDDSFLVDCVALNSLIGKCKGDTICIEVDGETVSVTHSKGKAEFSSAPAKEYPDFYMPVDGYTEVNIPSTLLSDCINTAKGFVGTDELRPQMQSIYCYVKDGEFGYCATDTRKMVTDIAPIANADGIDVNWYIAPWVFSAVAKTCKEVEDVVVKVSPSHVAYRFGNTIIQTVQTKGNYPDFNRVIPKDWAIECHIDRRELADSLTRVSMFSNSMRLIKMTVNQLDMSVSSCDLDNMKSSSETLQHNGCNGELTIGLHADYLATCLGACKSDEICLRLTDQSRPMLIFQAQKPNMSQLLMPMALAD